MKKETLFIRCGNIITDQSAPAGHKQEVFKSINAAKRHSRALQGALGDGSLSVMPHKRKAGKVFLDSSYKPGGKRKKSESKRETVADVAAKKVARIKVKVKAK